MKVKDIAEIIVNNKFVEKEQQHPNIMAGIASIVKNVKNKKSCNLSRLHKNDAVYANII